MKSIIVKYIKNFLLYSLVFLGMMLMSWCIPSKLLEDSVKDGISYIDTFEGGATWYRVFSYEEASSLDNFTDRVILECCVGEEGSLLESSMIPGYPRYWHGYTTFLRPLLCMFPYLGIRILYMFLHMFLLTWVIIELGRRERVYAFVFGFAMAVCNFIILPFSLQFSHVFFVMYLAIIWILKSEQKNEITKKFMVVGMCTSFVDLLTVPLITLGVPLIYYMLITSKSGWQNNVWRSIKCSFAWGIGYAVMWCEKWLLGSILLKRNLILDAIEEADYWVVGNIIKEDAKWGRLSPAIRNFFMLLPDNVTNSVLLFVLLILGILYIICLFLGHRRKVDIQKNIFLLVCAVMPYVWYICLVDHSWVHAFFTYRVQIISIIGVILFGYEIIDWNIVKGKCVLFIQKKA